MAVPALWEPMRCNWPIRMPAPASCHGKRRRGGVPHSSEPAGYDYREGAVEKVLLREKVGLVFDLVGGEEQKRFSCRLEGRWPFVSPFSPYRRKRQRTHHCVGRDACGCARQGTCPQQTRATLEEGAKRQTSRSVRTPSGSPAEKKKKIPPKKKKKTKKKKKKKISKKKKRKKKKKKKKKK